MAEDAKETTVATLESTAATYHDLAEACIGADAAFICSQLEKRATLEQAVVSWMREQKTRLEAAAKAADELKAESAKQIEAAKAEAVKAAEQAKASANKPGVNALASETTSQSETSDPVAAFEALVEAKQAKIKDRARAMSAAVRENPDLHASYIEAMNIEARKRGYGVRRRRAG